ncbi:hypothetical protein C8R47DRAFT_1176810 [Mycena vitilis]|nr:hypothetical protein C8R47DRAFT_1176810 [Mycena vitilis]
MAATKADTPKIALHWLEKSRSQRILWLLEELGRDPKTFRAPPELKTVHALGTNPIVTASVYKNHPCTGKSLVITIGERTFAESAFISEYLCAHFAGPSSTLIPLKWKDRCEGEVYGETEAWMRYRWLMHYCEGSLMNLITMGFIPWSIKRAPIPFFLRSITSRIANQLGSTFVGPEIVKQLGFLETQLESAPDGGPYLCGAQLTVADITMSYPLQISQIPQDGHSPLNQKEHPRLWAYTELLKESAGSKRAIEKIIAIEGKYNPNLF